MPAPRLLVFCQAYPPDPTSAGQDMADVCAEMAARGWHVEVLSSRRGYDDPSVIYPPRAVRDGAHVRRMPFTSFGKTTLFHRLIGQLLFVFRCVLRGWLGPRPAAVLVGTSPPMAVFAAAMVNFLRGVPYAFWVLDLNPDQSVEAGIFPRNHPFVRILNGAVTWGLERAACVITLDEYMAARIRGKCGAADPITIIPTWARENFLEDIPHDRNPFRREHNPGGKLAVLYSGNHSLVHPFDTILDAALRLRGDPRFLFFFIGGGSAKKGIEEFVRTRALDNVVCLPYQPIESLRFSLSSGDVHLVTMGDRMAGCVHPCKVYGAMALGRPILCVAPRPSHLSDLLDAAPSGMLVPHGDVQGFLDALERFHAMGPEGRRGMGRAGRDLIRNHLSKDRLCRRFCDILAALPQGKGATGEK